MVTVPVAPSDPLAISAVGVTVRVKVSLGSEKPSPMIGTNAAARVCPGRKVTVPAVSI